MDIVERKYPVTEFMSNKQLNKLKDYCDNFVDTITNSDKIEFLLEDEFETKDTGTNRLIMISKKEKFRKLIFKIAIDPHGIEANQREFFNGDISKWLTKSYSISSNGVVLVQERVTPMDRHMGEKYKDDICDMLNKLKHKILLVDCKLTNFKNFGLRKDGSVCLLDHGDTVPLPEYQKEIVNIGEETFVSLRCRHYRSKYDPSPCGGKLTYSKNFDYLICKKCEATTDIHDAYRDLLTSHTDEFSANKDKDVDSYKSWQDEYDATRRKYVEEKMAEATGNHYEIESFDEEDDNNTIENNELEGVENMKTRTIINGYYVPGYITEAELSSVRMLSCTIEEFLTSRGLPLEKADFGSSDSNESSASENSQNKTFSASPVKMVGEDERELSDDERKRLKDEKKQKKFNSKFPPVDPNTVIETELGKATIAENTSYDFADRANDLVEKAIAKPKRTLKISWEDCGVEGPDQITALWDAIKCDPRVYTVYLNQEKKLYCIIIDKNQFPVDEKKSEDIEVKSEEKPIPQEVPNTRRQQLINCINKSDSYVEMYNNEELISKSNFDIITFLMESMSIGYVSMGEEHFIRLDIVKVASLLNTIVNKPFFDENNLTARDGYVIQLILNKASKYSMDISSTPDSIDINFKNDAETLRKLFDYSICHSDEESGFIEFIGKIIPEERKPANLIALEIIKKVSDSEVTTELKEYGEIYKLIDAEIIKSMRSKISVEHCYVYDYIDTEDKCIELLNNNCTFSSDDSISKIAIIDSMKDADVFPKDIYKAADAVYNLINKKEEISEPEPEYIDNRSSASSDPANTESISDEFVDDIDESDNIVAELKKTRNYLDSININESEDVASYIANIDKAINYIKNH